MYSCEYGLFILFTNLIISHRKNLLAFLKGAVFAGFVSTLGRRGKVCPIIFVPFFEIKGGDFIFGKRGFDEISKNRTKTYKAIQN